MNWTSLRDSWIHQSILDFFHLKRTYFTCFATNPHCMLKYSKWWQWGNSVIKCKFNPSQKVVVEALKDTTLLRKLLQVHATGMLNSEPVPSQSEVKLDHSAPPLLRLFNKWSSLGKNLETSTITTALGSWVLQTGCNGSSALACKFEYGDSHEKLCFCFRVCKPESLVYMFAKCCIRIATHLFTGGVQGIIYTDIHHKIKGKARTGKSE